VGKDLLSDLSASLTVFFTLIPQGLAYATLAGMPPVFGLYAAGVPVIIYSLLGSSRHLVLGPFAITSLLVAKVCEPIPNIEVGGPMYVKIALTVTLMTGVVSLFAGIFKLGVSVQYLSSSVLSGFLTGCAILIIISQLKDVLGIPLPEKLYTHEVIIGLLSNLGKVKPYALAFSIPSFAALYGAAQWKRKNPNTPAKANDLLFQAMTWAANSSYFLVFLICPFVINVGNVCVGRHVSVAA
jgi:SulP family sulfate permease